MNGSLELQELAAALREAGEIGMRRELTRGMRVAATPVKKAVQAAAMRDLPHSGGLAAREAAAVQLQVLTSARTTVVRLQNRRTGAFQTDQTGAVRHPVYAKSSQTRREWTWVTQAVPGAEGWFSNTAAEQAPLVERQLLVAMARVEAKLLGGFGY